MSEDRVLTPGGYRARSLVHHLGPGHVVQRVAGRMRGLHLATGRLLDLPREPDRPDDIPQEDPPWVAYVDWTNNTGNRITRLSTTWRVPLGPATVGNQTIYLFDGMQNTGLDCGILQPVLKWNPWLADGGGPGWSVASWFVMNRGPAILSDEIRVQENDLLTGTISFVGENESGLAYDCEFVGILGTKLSMQGVTEFSYCCEVLEAYATEGCSDYPSTERTAFTGIGVWTEAGPAAIEWVPRIGPGNRGETASIVNPSAENGEVDILYCRASGELAD